MSDRIAPVCALIADDLTGACDAAAQFSACGYSAIAALDLSLIQDCASNVIAATTDSRADAPVDAAGKALGLAQLMRSRQSRLAFKKVDSVLRGNLASEIEACLKGFDCEACVIAPSFPLLGRQISGGWLKTTGGGEARIHLPTLLAEQGMTTFAHVDRAWSGGGVESLTARLEDEAANGTRCFIFDAVSDSDLEMAIAGAAALERRILWVGSAGLARQLAKRAAECDRERIPPPTEPERMAAGRGPILLAIGSDHPVTAEQLKRLAACRPAATVRPAEAGLRGAIEALEDGRNVVLEIEPGATTAVSLRRFLLGLEGAPVRGLVASGGDTASLVCSALDASFIRLEGEIATGIPWGRIGGGSAHGLPVATKSGGFGAPDTLVAAVDFLSGCTRGPEA